MYIMKIYKIYLFTKYLLSPWWVASTVPDTRETVVDKNTNIPAPA